jgi:8-oxo-dGTP diphosphatase
VTTSERWAFCEQGHVHWGTLGGAGLLLRHIPGRGEPVYLLAERSRWVDEAGTWGAPGGAIHPGESAEAAARRNATEQVWPIPAYRTLGGMRSLRLHPGLRRWAEEQQVSPGE